MQELAPITQRHGQVAIPYILPAPAPVAIRRNGALPLHTGHSESRFTFMIGPERLRTEHIFTGSCSDTENDNDNEWRGYG